MLDSLKPGALFLVTHDWREDVVMKGDVVMFLEYIKGNQLVKCLTPRAGKPINMYEVYFIGAPPHRYFELVDLTKCRNC